VTGKYWWGDDTATKYVISKENDLTNDGKSTVAVGKKDPNAWGL
jgi:hypothetical protein